MAQDGDYVRAARLDYECDWRHDETGSSEAVHVLGEGPHGGLVVREEDGAWVLARVWVADSRVEEGR